MGSFASQPPLKVTSKMRILKCNHSQSSYNYSLISFKKSGKICIKKKQEKGIENIE